MPLAKPTRPTRCTDDKLPTAPARTRPAPTAPHPRPHPYPHLYPRPHPATSPPATSPPRARTAPHPWLRTHTRAPHAPVPAPVPAAPPIPAPVPAAPHLQPRTHRVATPCPARTRTRTRGAALPCRVAAPCPARTRIPAHPRPPMPGGTGADVPGSSGVSGRLGHVLIDFLDVPTLSINSDSL
ncbi:hypothetical protein GGX14DRAFT_576082 [Mycena pura]|uniref:Uncharacterized protein n=1 Tax=Mycena pura TaxID=153505 RepID=A0AAD6UYG1_9AGAR|nr:hypothetical protein GGX14DRAFT_576079 [Mycena pura]KAJ7194874.1 hypothetical protein GGX14DRAFT_576082 [Mycena pura]